MSKMLVVMFAIACCAAGWADEVSVFDWQDLRYHDYSVGGSGTYGWIYDYQTRNFSGVLQLPHQSTIYNYGTNSFYDLRPTSPRTYSGYDYGTGTFQDYRLTPQGGVSVFDYGTMRFYDYSF